MHPKFKGWYQERKISSLPPPLLPSSNFPGLEVSVGSPQICMGGTLGTSSYLEILELGNTGFLEEERRGNLSWGPEGGRISVVKE